MNKIEKLINDLKSVVKKSSTGHLHLKYRVELMQLVNNPLTVNKIFFECVKKAYPIWEEQYPSNEIMIYLINKSNDYLYKQTGDKKEFAQLNDKYFIYFESLDGVHAIIGMAQSALCFNITYDASLILKIEDYEGQDDNTYDYDMWNPDFLCSIAWSQGNPFNNEGDISTRKEFWLWYLDIVYRLSFNPLNPVINLKFYSAPESKPSAELQRSQTYNTGSVQSKIDKIISLSTNLVNKATNQWEQVDIESCCIKSGNSSIIHYTGTDNEKIKIDNITYVSDYIEIPPIFNEIKKEMYEQAPREGAWIMCFLTIRRDDSFSISFNYDDIDTFATRAKSPENLLMEFNKNPRSKEFTPQWLIEILGKKAKYLK